MTGVLQFHGPRHTWGLADLISPRCVCSHNRELIILISVLTNKAWPGLMAQRPKLEEEPHSFWMVPRGVLSDMTVTLNAEPPFEDGGEHMDLCAFLLSFAYRSQIPGCKWRALVILPPLRRSSHYRKGWGNPNTRRPSPEIRQAGRLLTRCWRPGCLEKSWDPAQASAP